MPYCTEQCCVVLCYTVLSCSVLSCTCVCDDGCGQPGSIQCCPHDCDKCSLVNPIAMHSDYLLSNRFLFLFIKLRMPWLQFTSMSPSHSVASFMGAVTGTEREGVGGLGQEGDIQDLPRVECSPGVQGRLEVPHDTHAPRSHLHAQVLLLAHADAWY